MISFVDVPAIGSGALVGFVLGLIGGGGSILAVPLLIYVVGVRSPHVAIGTSAVAVALSAFANLIGHARAGAVKWPCALVFAAVGVAGAAVGSTLGKAFDGQKLLALFGVLMIVIAVVMVSRKAVPGDASVQLTRTSAVRLLPGLASYGAGVGLLSGFFGIGGGFLIVPGLVAATKMPLPTAIGSSLVAVTAFGLTTAVSYALSGLVDWRLVMLFVGGGLVGGIGGRHASRALAGSHAALGAVFAVVVASVGIYVIVRSVK